MTVKTTVNWLGTIGKVDVSDGVISHVPVLAETATQFDGVSPQEPVSIAKSNIEFEAGTIFFEVFLQEPKNSCQLVLNMDQEILIFIGLNVFNNAYGIALFQKNQWTTAASAALGDHPPTQKWIPLEIRVMGSVIQLFVSGVRVCTTSQPVYKTQLGIFFRGVTPVQVRNFRVESEKPAAFIVMQFTDEYNSLYQDVIKPTCESFGYSVVRGDDPNLNGPIIDDITRSIRESSIVIADITLDNPNVFYEVGYSHALTKPTILLSDRKRGKLPFDVSGFRTLFYDNTIGGKGVVEASLKKHLQSLQV